MIIDGHSHVTFPVEDHIRAMDQAGIDRTVLFSTTFHPENAKNKQEVIAAMQYLDDLLAGKKGSMVEVRKRSIAELLEAVRRYPDRYIGFGSLPAGLDLESTKNYIEENIQGNRLAGVGNSRLAAVRRSS